MQVNKTARTQQDMQALQQQNVPRGEAASTLHIFPSIIPVDFIFCIYRFMYLTFVYFYYISKEGHTAVWGEFSEVVWFGKKPFNLSRMGGDWRDVVNDLSAGTIGGGLENVIFLGVRRLHFCPFFSIIIKSAGLLLGTLSTR